jgi:hypothetical protein
MSVLEMPWAKADQGAQRPVLSRCLITTRCEPVIHPHSGVGDEEFYRLLNSSPDGTRLTIVTRENGQRKVYYAEWTSPFRCVGCKGKEYIEAWQADMPILMQNCRSKAQEYRDLLDPCPSVVGESERVRGAAISQETILKEYGSVPSENRRLDRGSSVGGQAQ